ncbi:thiolase family protein [Agrobacterium tumefaciens]|uniref:thiolase family protein n=1 Tax=Agrobacterium tumefaciens TaxID=358 RepID=UPI00287C578F|nr:thiolase family protein [Agrobacterium tumefaciens]MDS7593957.1 thiolase family protein [Agrobacterium tumefaciens]
MAGSLRHAYDDVVLTAPVTVPYRRYSIESTAWWVGRALAELVKASGISHRDFDGFSLSSFSTAPDTAIGLTQHFGLSPRFIEFVPMGGASGIVSLKKAARAVQCGDAKIVACIGADTNHVESFRKSLESFSRFSQDAVYPYGTAGPNASFALIASNYMRKYGAKREDFGKLAVSQRVNALKNPNALMKKPLTLEAYLAARPIAPPIHLFDCVMPCAGADAFLVMREQDARAHGLPFARLLSSIERHNASTPDDVQERGGWVVDIKELYSAAGVRPSDIDVVQTYDDYPVISMMQFEDLGFCSKGEGPDFVRHHDFTIGGTFPHNTSGGQLSVGQAGAAGGHLGIVEAMRQVMHIASSRQVPGAQLALAAGFGMINFDRGLSSGAVIIAGQNY